MVTTLELEPRLSYHEGKGPTRGVNGLVGNPGDTVVVATRPFKSSRDFQSYVNRLLYQLPGTWVNVRYENQRGLAGNHVAQMRLTIRPGKFPSPRLHCVQVHVFDPIGRGTLGPAIEDWRRQAQVHIPGYRELRPPWEVTQVHGGVSNPRFWPNEAWITYRRELTPEWDGERPGDPIFIPAIWAPKLTTGAREAVLQSLVEQAAYRYYRRSLREMCAYAQQSTPNQLRDLLRKLLGYSFEQITAHQFNRNWLRRLAGQKVELVRSLTNPQIDAFFHEGRGQSIAMQMKTGNTRVYDKSAIVLHPGERFAGESLVPDHDLRGATYRVRDRFVNGIDLSAREIFLLGKAAAAALTMLLESCLLHGLQFLNGGISFDRVIDGILIDVVGAAASGYAAAWVAFETSMHLGFGPLLSALTGILVGTVIHVGFQWLKGVASDPWVWVE